MDKIIIANWKMNPRTETEAVELAKKSDVAGLIIAPPFPFIKTASQIIKKAELGAQDLFWENPPVGGGAYTGEVSAEELKSLGVKYVIVGHFERRRNLGETDEMVAKKLKTALEAELTPILCVGESAGERDQGLTEAVVSRELRIGLSLAIRDSRLAIRPFVIAYEPIWAIGTGTSDTPQNMLNMVQYIRETLKELPISNIQYPIIYGGSVNSKNAEDFLKHKEIGGVLVGGASLEPEEIAKIVEIAADLNNSQYPIPNEI